LDWKKTLSETGGLILISGGINTPSVDHILHENFLSMAEREEDLLAFDSVNYMRWTSLSRM
jgi:hypothetical protein